MNIPNNTYYLRFPSVLRKALQNGEVAFDSNVEIEYMPFTVFRGITREKGESLEICRSDFLSYAELNKKPRGMEYNIGWYSCSCFKESKELEAALKLPRYNKKIISGFIKSEYGPQKTNNDTGHVDWWLYENTEVEKDFKVM